MTKRKDEWGGISPPNPHKGGGYHPLSGVDIPPGRDFPPTLMSCLLPFVNLSLRFHVNVFTINQLDLLMLKTFQDNFSFWYRNFMVSVSSYNQNQLEACCCIKMVMDFEALMMKKLGGGKQPVDVPLPELINEPVRPM